GAQTCALPISYAARPRPGSDAARAAARWHGPVVPFSEAEAARCGLLVDAVFGAGLARPVEDRVARVIAAAPGRVLAVDVPSGLDGATGQPRGEVRAADATVTFFRLKPGHLLLPGRVLCGAVMLADIGLPASVLPTVGGQAWRNGPGLWRLPGLDPTAHKYTRGHVTILAGAGMTGAARLAAAGARRGGTGLVTLAAPDRATGDVLRAGDPGVIVTEASVAALLMDRRRNAWVLGPGLEPQRIYINILQQIAAVGCQVVADAGVLAAAAGEPAGLRGAAVLTPHEGEFLRLFGPIAGDRPAAARRAAAATGAVVLLKGPDTVIAAPDGRLAINDHAPPWLASGGTGDVLAGLIAALIAQGLPPFEAAAAAAWVHGDAAWRSGSGLIAEDLPPHLNQAIEGARSYRD
ncbi:NAD(P)H-hydrate dehydratase, partial [Neoroseomonas rubea]|uniref:NAD(P)H-hydrate dehydratase n=1 Tax=Neoroseomonas rubea TaxID=2748666 RepID=UPI0018E03799